MSDKPIVSFDAETRQWTLEADYVACALGRRLLVRGGFPCDLASIPRLFWSLIPPYELSIAAPFVHDTLYRKGGLITDVDADCLKRFTRAQADRIFLELMVQHGVPAWKCWVAYFAVRWFGARSWRP